MQTIEIDRTSIAFADEGAGKPVVLLHSSAGSKTQWRDAFAAWTDHYRVMAPDLLGYGETGPWEASQPHTLLDEVEIAAAVIARAGRPVHLVGHSYGGTVALRTALALGPQIASLSLIEPTAFHLLAQEPAAEPYDSHGLAEITEVLRDIEQALATGFHLSAARRFIEYWCGEGAWLRLSGDRKAQIGSHMPKVRQDFCAQWQDKTSLAEVTALEVPTLILCGTNSPHSTRSLSRVLAEAIPGARHRTVANAGHMLPVTHSKTVNAFILDHMERVDREGHAQAPRAVTPSGQSAADRMADPTMPRPAYGHRPAQA